jgi:hypothetical protein
VWYFRGFNRISDITELTPRRLVPTINPTTNTTNHFQVALRLKLFLNDCRILFVSWSMAFPLNVVFCVFVNHTLQHFGVFAISSFFVGELLTHELLIED